LSTHSSTRKIVVPSALYPYRSADDLSLFDYQNFQLVNVFGKITSAQRQQCIQMWRDGGVPFTEHEALQRSQQVCYLFRHIDSGELAGVNTLYKEFLPQLKSEWFCNRMYIRPEYRTSRLMVLATTLMLYYSWLHLRKQQGSNGERIRGVANINDNIKLHRKGMRRIFERVGYRYSHKVLNREVWLFAFDEIDFTPCHS